MDDDLSFGASVWASSTTELPASERPASSAGPSFPALISPVHDDAKFQDEAFDDNDFDLNTPFQESANTIEDDDFGDFGDFGDGATVETAGGFAQPVSFAEEVAFPSETPSEWEALQLDPLPSSSSLKTGIGDMLQSLWDSFDVSQFLTEDNIRQVGGLNQVLVTPESRSLYQALYQSPPPHTQPPNWTRSRIRRRHLVSLGIPVNLDEVLPHVNGKAMPALQISTRPMSAPPGPRALNRVTSPPPGTAVASRPGSRPGSRPPSRSGTPNPSPLSRAPTYAQLGLGPEPEVDENSVAEILALTPEHLSLLPLSTLEAHLARVQSLTTQTSSLLAHLLQQRDALQQDAETYNKLIAELVSEAQKMKSGPRTRTGGTRRASGMA